MMLASRGRDAKPTPSRQRCRTSPGSGRCAAAVGQVTHKGTTQQDGAHQRAGRPRRASRGPRRGRHGGTRRPGRSPGLPDGPGAHPARPSRRSASSCVTYEVCPAASRARQSASAVLSSASSSSCWLASESRRAARTLPGSVLQVCDPDGIDPVAATRAQVGVFIRELTSRPSRRDRMCWRRWIPGGLSNARCSSGHQLWALAAVDRVVTVPACRHNRSGMAPVRAVSLRPGLLGSGGGAAAVDGDGGPVDEAGFVAGEVGDSGAISSGSATRPAGASAANRSGMSP
jgi:hypothetical protein